MTLLEN